jgi:hypothetical protein
MHEVLEVKALLDFGREGHQEIQKGKSAVTASLPSIAP